MYRLNAVFFDRKKIKVATLINSAERCANAEKWFLRSDQAWLQLQDHRSQPGQLLDR